MASFYELNAFLEEEGAKKPFFLKISHAKESGEDFFCTVEAPALFKNDRYIYGSDADQASELAVKFVRNLLEGKKITDSNGKPIAIAQYG